METPVPQPDEDGEPVRKDSSLWLFRLGTPFILFAFILGIMDDPPSWAARLQDPAFYAAVAISAAAFYLSRDYYMQALKTLTRN